MSVGAELDAFQALGKALGILKANGDANDAWFADPVGVSPGATAGNTNGLRNILADDTQREALEAFVDEVLGAPDRTTRDGATWVPLFRETSPAVTIYAVLKPVVGAVHIGIGLEHAMAPGAPSVATRIHVPIFRVQRGPGELQSDPGVVPWLLLGRPEARIDVSLDLTLRDDTPPAGEASLGGLAVALGIPTDGSPDLRLAIELRDLQLPGASSTRTMVLDAATPGELGAEVLELLATLVRAQVDALTSALPAEVAGLVGLLGLRDVPNLPPLPLGELPTRGLDALVEWLRSVFATSAARTAWFGQLRQIIGGAVDAGAGSVSRTAGPVTFTVGVRTATGTSGALTVTPWLSLALDTTAGARVRLLVDILRADLSTGAVTAIPDIRAEALFGTEAGGAALLTGDPGVGGVRAGLILKADRRPAFSLTLHGVTLAGRSHALLDISSPDAAVSALDTVVASALDSALAGFGPAGALLGNLLGIRPPAGVTGVSSGALLTDPLAEMTRYWRDLSAAPTAMASVLGSLRALVTNTPTASVPGNGTKSVPWRVELLSPLVLLVWRDGGALIIDVALDVTTPVLDGHVVQTTLRGSLLKLSFTPVQVTFVGAISAVMEFRRTAGALQLDLDVLTLSATALRAVVGWSPSKGLQVDIEAPDAEATLLLPDAISRFTLPVPVRGPDGRYALPPQLWPDAQALIVALASQARVPVIDECLKLIGWTGNGAELSLATLTSGDPEAAVRAWLADAVLDCDRVRDVMGVVATVLSGGSITTATGSGGVRSPYRAPVAGDSRAPALAAWLVPPCPPRFDFGKGVSPRRATAMPEDGESMVGRLQVAAEQLPDLSDLLAGRSSLSTGIEQLVTRWTDTDGVLAVPLTVPTGVSLVQRDGSSYDDLVAEGASGLLVSQLGGSPPATVLHVGCEEIWRTDRPAGRGIDASTETITGSITAAGTGEWFLLLPSALDARAARPDRDAVLEQADRLRRVLAARTAPLTVVAYGACGAAALRAAMTLTVITEVVTVGTPWTAPSVTAFRSGLGADALRVLERLLRSDAVPLPPRVRAMSATPIDVMSDVVRRALLVASDDGALLNAGAESRRSGLSCRAVFGALTADTVRHGMAALIDDGMAARFEAARAAAIEAVPRSALHVGVDIPVLAADVGGVSIGLGATLELAALERDAALGVRVSTARGVTVRMELGITDGWLIGGPSPEPGDVDLRRMSVHVTVPFDGSAGETELVLHEASGLGAFRERWVVLADADGLAATQALPEVRAIMSAVLARLRSASPALGTLLDVVGLVRDGGLDAAGLDRLLFEPQLVAAQVRARAVEVATSLRTMVTGMAGSASALTWTVGDATFALDVASRTVSVGVATQVAGWAPLSIAATLGADGRATAEFALGALDPQAGGVRLVGRAGATNSVAVEWRGAGVSPIRTMALLPTPDVTAFSGFASTVLPAYLMQAVAGALREQADEEARAALDAALDALALLHTADDVGHRAVRLPLALFDDAAGWLLHGAESWRTDPVGGAVRVLDALAPVLAPARGTAAGWPIVNGVVVRYSGTGGRLALSVDATIDATVGTAAIATRLIAGVRISNDGRVEPLLDAGVTVDGTGLQLAVSPALQLSLVRPSPAPVLPLYPAGAGLGSVLSAVGESVLPPVLNALAARRTEAAASLGKDVARAVFDIGGALDLRDGNNFTAARLTNFAIDPASRLLGRLPNLIGLGAGTLARALDPLETVVRVIGPTAGEITLQFGTARQIALSLDSSGVTPVVRFSGSLPVPAIGNIAIDELRLAADGVSIGVRVGPASILVGGVTLRPVLSVRAGVSADGISRLAAFGLAVNETGSKAVELRWALNDTPPVLAVVTRGVSESLDVDPARVALSLLSVAASIASGIALPVLQPILPPQAFRGLEKVLFVTTGGTTTLDPTLFDDLLQPERLFDRLKRLAWNLATDTTPLSITIDGTVTIALVSQPGTGSAKRLGIALTLPPGRRLELASGDPTVALEADASWITGTPVPAGITITMLEGTVTTDPAGDTISLEVVPGFTIGGVGLRFTKAGGPLLNLGPISLDGIAVHLFGEVSAAGVGGGVQLELAGLAIAPSGASGNPVAGGILSDASRGGANNRPAFSPAVAVQARAGGDIGVTVRAGPPPGPWWLVIQRELGPLYLERIGFDSTTTAGTITRLQLLFDGRVSLFGMTAAVDQLSLTWRGGDVFDATRWSADLNGLAISADMAGVMIAGGLLKDSTGGYMGMLLGRFGTYGLTLYGGYALLEGNPSFFIFGALNGPIGGPPAFFITGIGAGLGINRQLRVPGDFSEFTDYPFIKALDVAASVPDPMVELQRLNTYFRPQVGQFWVAAGISFTCFALVDGIAVVAVAFGSDGIDINLLGLARMALPRPGVAIVSIELGLIARFSTREGIFSIRAQLTENSWLLYEDVRLTGGFAFVVWWKGPLKGQFVLTIGGYHPRFHRDGYPEVPRVGLCWQVSDAIVIKGGAYFALTSEALMAGLEVTVSADFGWAWARIEFGANGLVYFDPFWFEVEVYARISAGVKIETWLGTIRFSLSTGATMIVHGPEFGGRATLEIGPASITVPFGSDNERPGDLLDWPAFITKYLEDGSGGGARALSAITGVGTLTRKASENKAESADGSAERPFEVFGEFQIAITSTIPITNVVLGPSNAQTGLSPKRVDGSLVALGLSPMGKGNLRTKLTLTLVGTSAEPGVAGPKPGVLDGQVERIVFDTEAFPIGVWGEPSAQTIPALPQGDVIFAMNRVRFDLRRQVGNSQLPAIQSRRVKSGRDVLPLQARGGQRVAMFATAGTVAVPAPTTAKAAMLEASNRLFAVRTTTVPDGVQHTGTRGASSAAAFHGERVSPPMFGTLADGLRRTNAADGASSEVFVGPIKVGKAPRAPKLAGVLAGGAGVIERGPATSVSDGSLKRRPAPSIDSVRTRLTRQLPVQLARTARPGVTESGTIIAAGVVPFTAVPGVARSMSVGRKVSRGALGQVVAGLDEKRRASRTGASRKGAAAASGLHAGDLVVLHSPDASIDLDERLRPALSMSGQARVTMTASDGEILLDVVAKDRVTIPPRTAMIGVQAAGDIAVRDGLAGWHERTRLGRFNARNAVGPGCALQLEGVVKEATPAWLDAGALVMQATAVQTRFTVPVTTVVVVLAGADVPKFDDVIVELDGATRRKARNGALVEPRVVMAGARATLVYDVVPVRAASVSVRVQTGGQWRLVGVLGGAMDSEAVARSIAVRGVAALAGRLLVAADGAPVSVTWEPAPQRVGTSAPKRAAKTAAKKRTAATRAATGRSTAGSPKKAATQATKKPAKAATRKATKTARRKTTKTAATKTSTRRSTPSTRRGGTSHAR